MIAVLKESICADFALECHGFGSGEVSSESLEAILSCAARCAVAFADLLGVKPFHSTDYTLECHDAVLRATIECHLGECKVVSLQNSTSVTTSAFSAESLPVICEGEVG